jgi:hypothetical protein
MLAQHEHIIAYTGRDIYREDLPVRREREQRGDDFHL